MISLLVVLALAASPQPKTRLALPGLTPVKLDAETVGFFSEHLAQQLKGAGLEVITNREISSMLGMERQKQLSGCADAGTSCMAELASALGAEALVLGDVARLGSFTQLNLKVIKASDGTTLATYTDRTSSDEGTVDSLSRGALELARQTWAALGRAPPEVASSGGGAGKWWWVPAASGVVIGGVGAGLLVSSNADFTRLTGASPASPLSTTESAALRETGKTSQLVGGVLIGVGGAAILGGVVLALVGRSSPVTVSLVPSPGGGSLTVGGALP